jgi:hypothetical protein
MSRRPYADWSTEALRDYEQRLYAEEVAGDEDNWFERDKVLWELGRRESDFE